MFVSERRMEAEAGSSGTAVTTTQSSAKRLHLRLNLAAQWTSNLDTADILSELEGVDDVTETLLDRLYQLVTTEESFNHLSEVVRTRLVELVIRKVCSKRRDEDALQKAFEIFKTVAKGVLYSGETCALFHTILDACISVLNESDSSDVRAKVLVVLRDIVAHVKPSMSELSEQQNSTLRRHCDRVVESSMALMRDSHGKVRCVASKLLAVLVRSNALSSDALERQAFRCVVNGATDFDAAVRASALRSLLHMVAGRMEGEGETLSRLVDDWTALYRLACDSLNDDYDDVRAAALRCVFLLAHTEALRERPASDGEETVMRSTMDDAFVRLCSAMTDGSGTIRVSAARLLGAFGRLSSVCSVSFDCVREAVEPRIMVDLRAERTMYRRQADRFRGASGRNVDLEGWSASSATQSDAQKGNLACGDLDISEMPLAISARSANGALIAGLEDELAAVRNATLRTIVQLASTFLRPHESAREVDSKRIVKLALNALDGCLDGQELDSDDDNDNNSVATQRDCKMSEESERLRNGRRFVALTQDYLVDMINDEIEFVRVNAVRQLGRLGDSVYMRQDQLEIVLSALKEASRDVRDSLRHLLCTARFTSKECLRDAVRALLDNLMRYPDDRIALLPCFARLGRTHSEFVSPLIAELLNSASSYETIEPPLDDPAYTCVLLLVLNACAKDAIANVQLPAFVVRHYEFLRSSTPHLVPATLQVDLHPSFAYSVGERDSLSHNRLVKNVRASTEKLSQANRCLAQSSVSNTADYSRVLNFVNLLLDDLARIAMIDQSAFALAEKLALDAQIQLLQSIVQSESPRNAKRLRDACVKFAELNSLFCGLPSHAQRNVQRWRLLVYAMQFATEPFDNVFDLLKQLTRVTNDCELALSSHNSGAKRSKLDDNDQESAVISQLLELLQNFRETLKQHVQQGDLYDDVVPSVPLATFRSNLKRLMRDVQARFRFSTLCLTDVNEPVQRTRLVFNEPCDSVDTPIRFSAGLCATIHVDATLSNLADPSMLEFVELLLRFADGTTLVFPVHHDAVRQFDDAQEASRQLSSRQNYSYRIITDISLTQPKWSDETVVELSAEMRIPNASVSAKACTTHLPVSNKPVRLLLLPKGKRTK